ncbi:hypothetical protein EBR66_03825 [bacterium]|nr:hypothetical protein [bacterium]
MVTVHLIALSFVFLTMVISDIQAVQWFFGKKQVLSEEHLRRSHYAMWAGLIAMIVSGMFLAYPEADYLLHNVYFIAKLLFVATLIVNAVLIGRIMHIATTTPFATLSSHEKIVLLSSGAMSLVSWIAAASIGFFVL